MELTCRSTHADHGETSQSTRSLSHLGGHEAERERDRRNRERGNTARCQQGLAVSEARSDTHSASYKHTERLGIRRCGLQNWPCTGFAKHLRDFPASRKHSNSLERIVKPRTVSRLFQLKGLHEHRFGHQALFIPPTCNQTTAYQRSSRLS